MAKPKKKYATCPGCTTDKHRTEMTVCMSVLEKIERKQYKHYSELDIDTYSNFVGCSFEWACDACLQDKRAILAAPGLQAYSSMAHLAYYDTDLTCRTCQTPFRFTKEEKQRWYEKLKFWTDAEPVNCLKCRREIRLLKSENQTLSDILTKDREDISLDELKTVADIYRKWDKTDKAKYYDALFRARAKLQP